MARLTTWDVVRGCYVIDPNASGNHIQKLGRLEDRDEPRRKKHGDAEEIEFECGACDAVVTGSQTFCHECGQRLRRD